jgi:hypothetical protein
VCVPMLAVVKFLAQFETLCGVGRVGSVPLQIGIRLRVVAVVFCVLAFLCRVWYCFSMLWYHALVLSSPVDVVLVVGMIDVVLLVGLRRYVGRWDACGGHVYYWYC